MAEGPGSWPRPPAGVYVLCALCHAARYTTLAMSNGITLLICVLNSDELELRVTSFMYVI